ncbi:hypothetical protein [Streptomyces sp. NBC_00670]|uniref:hypothetical protein n=1 Tax=Streptomyces sp. NBC_00670 TaxID=2975804 RepID=UPI002E367C62|nr:hypothetical protein [Streptomyces sp. NBC_00670]
MVEPMSAAASGLGRAAGTALGKSFQANGRTRLGGREERRAVYAHFQSCVINAFVAMYRQSEWAYLRFTPFFYASQRQSADRVLNAHAAMQDALAELMLVGNDKPRQAGYEAALVVVALNVRRGPGSRVNKERANEFWERMEEYVEACQVDLWYLPRWWQLWRPSWWSARWQSMKVRRAARKEGKV